MFNYLTNMMKTYNNNIGVISRKTSRADKDKIIKRTSFLDPKASFEERVYNILKPNSRAKCKHGNEMNFFNYDKGYTRFCSKSCLCNSESRKKIKEEFYKNQTEEQKEQKLEKMQEAIDKNKSWVPEDPDNFSKNDLIDYLKEKMLVHQNKISNLEKIIPNFVMDKITEYDDVSPKECRLSERLFNLLNPGQKNVCNCGNDTSFISYEKGYRTFCENSNVCRSKVTTSTPVPPTKKDNQ